MTMALRIATKRPLKTLKPLLSLKNVLRFGKPIAVQRTSSATLYIEKTGWKQSTSTSPAEWHGYFRTRFGSWKGKIKTTTPPQYSIYKPPAGLTTKHSHKRCFDLASDGWCSVHFNIVPKDLDSGVIKLERILYEAYLLTQKSA
jgi:hypothetical protein